MCIPGEMLGEASFSAEVNSAKVSQAAKAETVEKAEVGQEIRHQCQSKELPKKTSSTQPVHHKHPVHS